MTQLEALIVTLVVEAGTAALLALTPLGKPSRAPALALVAIAASLVTHPVVWQANAMLRPMMRFPARLALLETLVVLAEAVGYAFAARLAPPRALAVAAIANAASVAVGLFIMYGLR